MMEQEVRQQIQRFGEWKTTNIIRTSLDKNEPQNKNAIAFILGRK